MKIDKELAEDFIAEVQELQKELKIIVDKLLVKHTQPDLYKEFSQKVDRIYGTAITIGLNELGQYTKAIKDVSEHCSYSSNEMAQKKVLNMMTSCLESLDIFCKSIENPKLLKQIATNIIISTQKANTLEKMYFANIKK